MAVHPPRQPCSGACSVVSFCHDGRVFIVHDCVPVKKGRELRASFNGLLSKRYGVARLVPYPLPKSIMRADAESRAAYDAMCMAKARQRRKAGAA